MFFFWPSCFLKEPEGVAAFVTPALNFGITAIGAQLFFICSTFKLQSLFARGEKEFDGVAA